MPKTAVDVHKFIEVLEEAGYKPKPYSGRGMYGKQCVSISGDDITVWGLAKHLFSEVYDGQFHNTPEPHQDSLGLGIVLYWPSYAWPKDGDV